MKIFLENRSDEAVYYEGKRLPLKKENKTTYSAEIPDGEGEAEIRIVRRSELSDKFWALFALLFWVIGIMGFFTPRYSKDTDSLDCKIRFTRRAEPLYTLLDKVPLKRRKVVRGMPPPVSCVRLRVGETAQTIEPLYVPDERAARRRKKYKLFSWLARIVLIALIIFLAVYFTVNG